MVQFVTCEGDSDQYGVSWPLEGFHGPSDLGSAPPSVRIPGNAPVLVMQCPGFQGQEGTYQSDFLSPVSSCQTNLSIIQCKVQIKS